MDDHYYSCVINHLEKIDHLEDEKRTLKLRILELEAEVELQKGKHEELEQHVCKIINSPGSASDQMKIWSEKVEILQQITDLQSSLIDKEFIIKQHDELQDLRQDLRGALDLASSPETNSSQGLSSPGDSDNNSNITVDELSQQSHVSSPASSRQGSPVPSSDSTPCPPLKLKRGQTFVLYNSRVKKPAATSDLHSHDRERVQKCVQVLERLHSIRERTDTLLITDSIGHKIKAHQLDPDNRNTWVLSTGGLCIPSLVHALRQHGTSYHHIQKVSLCVGTNDFLHRAQHLVGERGSYLEALYEEVSKCFPNACMYFVLPCTGGKVPKSFIDSLHRDISSHIPGCIVLTPPDMRSKFNDGIHLNQGGVAGFSKFLQQHLVPRRHIAFSRDSGRRSSSPTYAGLFTAGCEDIQDVPSPSWSSQNSFTGRGSSPPYFKSPSELPQIDRHFVAEVTAEVVSELLSRNLIHH